MSRRRSLRRDQRGSVSVELVAITPFILLIAMAVLWMGIAAVSAISANEAARAAARAASLHRDPLTAARQSLPEDLRDGAVVTGGQDGDAMTYTVRVRVPRFFDALPVPDATVSRTVSMPDVQR